MAVIREELTLIDKFSSVFSKYLDMGRQMASGMNAAGAAQESYNRVVSESGGALSEMAGAADSASGSMGNISDAVQDTMDAGGRTAVVLEEINSAVQKLAGSSNKAADEQKKVNQRFQEGAKSADALTGKLKGLITTYLSFQGLRRALSWVGENLELANIQRNAENQLRAVLNNMGAQEITVPITADLQIDASQAVSAFDAITEKASEIQGRGIYGDEAMIAGAAELATYFEDANAVISMMDTLADYTMGMTGGGAVGKDQMVQYATDIGKIMTGSYAAMTKKGFEFTEAQEAIIEGTATEAQIVEALGKEYLDMSSDMQAAAAINSVIAESWGGLYDVMSNTPEGKIIQLQNSLGDLREMLGDRIYPAVVQVVEVFNNNFDKIERVLIGFSDVCSGIVVIIGWIADAAINAAAVIAENSDLVLSVLIGIGTVAVAAGAAMAASALASAAAWAAANWPLLLIVAAVTAIIQKTLQMGGTWEDVCGIMGSVIYELYAVIYNVVADAWNLFAAFAEFLANVFVAPLNAAGNLFVDLGNWVLSILKSIASAIDAVFGSNLTSAVSNWQSGLSGWAKSHLTENAVKIQRMEKIDYGEAWEKGSSMGKNFYNSLAELDSLSIPTPELPVVNLDTSALDGISSQLGDIGGDTKAIKNSVSLADEELKLLVDLAERDYITEINLTAQTPVINVSGQNTGNTELDRQQLAEAIKIILLEESASHTVGAYT